MKKTGYEKIINKGLDKKEYNGVLDRYLMRENKRGDFDLYSTMGEEKIYSQKDVIDIIKRSFKRVAYKLTK